jgi:hypothetical protein
MLLSYLQYRLFINAKKKKRHAEDWPLLITYDTGLSIFFKSSSTSLSGLNTKNQSINQILIVNSEYSLFTIKM